MCSLLENEPDLQRRFIDGEENALAQIIDLYSARIFHYCFNTLCDYHDAQDALQLVFIKAYTQREKFQGRASLLTWLYRIAANTCMDQFRGRKKIKLVSLDEQDVVDIPFVFPSEENKDILAALKRLSPKERGLVYLRAVEEKSYAELGQIFKTSETALRKRYERAKKKLMQDIAPDFTEERSAKNE